MKKRDIERIKGIKERVDRTTPGKWMVEKYYHDEPYEEYIKSAAVVTKHSTITRNDWSNPVEADLDFIANARQDIPYLLDKIDELYALNRELTEILESLVLQHKQLEEFVELQFFTPTPGDQICKNFNVDLVVVEKGWFERVEKLLAKCKEVE